MGFMGFMGLLPTLMCMEEGMPAPCMPMTREESAKSVTWFKRYYKWV
jgi:hypothetical protein